MSPPSSKNASSTSRPLAIRERPYAILGGAVVVALALVLLLAFLGFAGTGPVLLTPEAALFAVVSAVVVLAISSLYVLFTLRSTSRVVAQLAQDVQTARDMNQDGRLVTLEGARVGSRIDHADMSVEIERLESRIASLENPRVVPAKPLVSLVPIVIPVLTPQPPTAPSAPTRAAPFGDVHAVIDIEGIGPHYAVLLNAANVYNTRQLWEADPEQVAATLELPVVTIDKWQAMCELLAVKGIGPQYAELLVRSGIGNIRELRDAAPAALLSAISKTQLGTEVRIQGNAIGATTVANWIRAARDHKPGRTNHAYPTGTRAAVSP